MNQSANSSPWDEIDFSGIDLDDADAYMLKALVFENNNRQYDIRFNRTRILQIKGDSSTGKTLFATDLREQRDHIPGFPNVLVISSTNRESLGLLTDLHDLPYDLVVIDNADILITDELDKAIFRALVSENGANDTYWIIIGRKWFDCCSYGGCRGILESRRLKKNRYAFSINYVDHL